jgi:hypothetical protein
MLLTCLDEFSSRRLTELRALGRVESPAPLFARPSRSTYVKPADLPATSDEKSASPQESAVAVSPEEEDRGPFLISPSQVRTAKVIWPDVDLNRRTWPKRAAALVEVLKATGRALARGWRRD